METPCRMLLVLALALPLGSATPAPTPTPTAAGSALDLHLLHVNDMHARYEETSQYSGSCAQSDAEEGLCYGGYARVAALIKAERAADQPHTLWLNAGDNYQGTIYYTVFKWNISAHFNNWLDFDATTLGNHEFDDHVAGLVPYVKALRNPLVVSNVNFTAEPALADLGIPKSVVVERGGYKIGVIGYLTPNTSYLSSPDLVTFSDEVEAVRLEAQRLTKQGVNIIIGLGHSGYDVDQVIAAEVDEVDLIVGGHSHSFLYTGRQPDSEVPVGLYPTWITQKSGKRVPVVQAYAFTKYLGKLAVSFDAAGNLLSCIGLPVLLNKDVKPDNETAAEVQRWKDELSSKVLMPVGSTEVVLDYLHCRQRECNIGNLIADSGVYYRAKYYRGSSGWTDAPIAMINSGVIRSSIDATSVGGTVTLKDVMEVLPYDDLDVLLTLRGSVLRKAMEHSVEQYIPNRTWHGQFLQYSGAQVTYDASRPPGSRVVSALVRCGNCSVPAFAPLDDSALYNVIVNSFMANGGDGYTMLEENEGSVAFQSTDSAILQAYFADNSPVYAQVEGRITILVGNETATSTTTIAEPTAAPSRHSKSGGNTSAACARSAAPLAAFLISIALLSM